MKFFNLFGKKKHEDPPFVNPAMTVPESLFVDKNEPRRPSVVERRNRLMVFLEKDYEDMGVREGYLHAHSDAMDSRLSQLLSEYRLVLDFGIDEKKVAVDKLKVQLIRSEDVSEKMAAELKERIRQLEGDIHQLDTQKILSVEGEGMIADVLNKYKKGFKKGTELFVKEQDFMKGKGLFS